MAIIRSRVASAGTAQLHNAEVERALMQWQERITSAREEGRLQGIQETKKLSQEVAGKIKEVEQRTQKQIQEKEQQWHQRWSQVLNTFQEALDEVSILEKQALQSAESQLLDLAIDLAGKICHQHMQMNPQWMKEIIIAAMKDVPDKRQVRIRMHPQDAQELRMAVTEIHQNVPDLVGLEIIEDQQLAQGSLLMESKGTVIDAGIPATWQRLAEELRVAAPSSEWSALAIAGPDGTAPKAKVNVASTENDAQSNGESSV